MVTKIGILDVAFFLVDQKRSYYSINHSSLIGVDFTCSEIKTRYLSYAGYLPIDWFSFLKNSNTKVIVSHTYH